jgi:hypothetical protein
MKQGGNTRLRDFFRAQNSEHSSIENRYQSTAAEIYRSKLKEVVQNSLLSNPPSISSLDLVDSITIECTFLGGPMGMTLMKDLNSRAIVSRVVTDGQAFQRGVCVGDVLESIGGKKPSSYEELMDLILLLARPIQVQFLRLRPIHFSPSPSSSPSLLDYLALSQSRPQSLRLDSTDAPSLNLSPSPPPSPSLSSQIYGEEKEEREESCADTEGKTPPPAPFTPPVSTKLSFQTHHEYSV